jgi:hypothetical protein
MLSIWYRRVVYCSALLVFAGCTTNLPMGPRVAVMPAPGKPFEVFAAEDRMCRQYAEQSIGSSPNQVASQNAVSTTAAGVAIGTAAGALLGGREGAPTGAAVGLLAGSTAGLDQAAYASRDTQWRYDIAYQQCMYAKGNQVPGYHLQQVPPPPPHTGDRRPAPYPTPPPPPR